MAHIQLLKQNNVTDWRLILTEDQINQLNDYVANQINTKFQNKSIVVTSILKGAVYFTVDLTRRLTIPHSLYFIEASSYKGQTQDELELLSSLGPVFDSKIIPSKFENKTVILIDELYDNGLTLHQVKNKLLEEVPSLKAEDIFTCVLFKKNKETKYPLPDLVGIQLPNVWLVGYGLDDQQTKRNWKNLFAAPKPENLQKTLDDNLFDDEHYYQQQLDDIQNNILRLC